VVDTVAPEISVTLTLSETYRVRPGVVLSGTASDGDGVSRVTVHLNSPSGGSREEEAVLTNGTWSYSPRFRRDGIYTMYVEARDWAGNLTRRGPFRVGVAIRPIGGSTVPALVPDLMAAWLWLAALVGLILAGGVLPGRRR